MTRSTCHQAREWLIDEQRGRLSIEHVQPLRQHLERCPQCAQLDQEERVLTELLHTKLEQPSAPVSLKQRLAQQALAASQGTLAPAQQAPTAGPQAQALAQQPPAASHDAQASTHAPARSPRPRRSWQLSAAGFALAACALLGIGVEVTRRPSETSLARGLVQEAVNDHLRVLYAAHPIEVERGIHEVKPWFTGRIDFAPDVAFSGDADFPLVGGAVGYMVDRKAATFMFKRRLHTITLLVFRADGLAWPTGDTQKAGTHDVLVREQNGFHLVIWQSAGLGHVLISDVSSSELLTLCAKLDTPT